MSVTRTAMMDTDAEASDVIAVAFLIEQAYAVRYTRSVTKIPQLTMKVRVLGEGGKRHVLSVYRSVEIYATGTR